jgi:hypothetical protein
VDEEERENRRELSKYAGPREFFRLGCFIAGCGFLVFIIGLILELVFKLRGYGEAFVAGAMGLVVIVFPILARFWKPARSLMNKIIGNDNLYPHPLPLSKVKLTFKNRPWPYYVILLWEWFVLIVLIYLVIKYFTK